MKKHIAIISALLIGSSIFTGTTVSAKSVKTNNPVSQEATFTITDAETLNHYYLSYDGRYLTMETNTFREKIDTYNRNHYVGWNYTTSGNRVKVAQILLNSQPDGNGLDVDGYFGPKTDARIRQFQSRKNLSSDGIIGRDTWKALCEDLMK